jgi:tetratricopeptide (TPR) repeat protein
VRRDAGSRPQDHVRSRGYQPNVVETVTATASQAIDSLLKAARDAEYRRDWSAAISFLTAARDRSPDEPRCHVELGVLLWHAGQGLEAERTLSRAVDLFPAHSQAAIQHAKLPTWGSEWDEALLRWARVRERFPGEASAWSGTAAALLDMGRPEEAETLLREARSRFPDSSDVAAWYATVAFRRGQWAEAERRLAVAGEAFPTHPGIKLARQRLDHVSTPIDALDAARERGAPGGPSMLLRFESLGEDCEFGKLQRRFGCEPRGLFRFAGVSSGALLTTLETECRSIGDPKNTSVYVRTRGREYIAVDTHLKMLWHTGLFQYAADRQRVLEGEHRRLGSLRRKLVGDLAAGEKIFVYVSHTPLDVKYCESLAGAVQRYSSKAVVLCVGPAASREGPRVSWGGEGLLVAERSAMLLLWRWPDDEAAPPYQQWLHICAKATELVDARRSAAGPSGAFAAEAAAP